MFLVTDQAAGPLYLQIYGGLRERILSGLIPPGGRLPASRALAADLGLSRNVVVLAYEQLVSEGYAESRVGSGTFVSATLPERSLHAFADRRAANGSPARSPAASPAPRRARLSPFAERARRQLAPAASPSGPAATGAAQARALPFDFRYGSIEPDQKGLLQWRRLLSRRAGTIDLGYGAPEGEPRARRAIAEYLGRARGVACDPDQVIVVSGSQQGLDLAARVLLSAGDAVLIEEPQYRGARHVFLAAGADLVPGKVDAEGLDVEALSTPREDDGAGGGYQHRPDRDFRLAYVTPSHQFPTGAVMSLTRRLGLLEWAERTDAYVLEDDYDSEFRYQGRPIGAVQGLDAYQRTIYIGTFSKVLFPALRLGYLVLPPHLVEPFRAAKWLNDRHTATLEQTVLADFIEEGFFEQHLRRVRAASARRRAALLAALDRHLAGRVETTGTNAGLHAVVWLLDRAVGEVDAIESRAAERGVGVYSVAPLYLRPPGRAGLLLGYAALDEAAIEEGIRRLAAVL